MNPEMLSRKEDSYHLNERCVAEHVVYSVLVGEFFEAEVELRKRADSSRFHGRVDGVTDVHVQVAKRRSTFDEGKEGDTEPVTDGEGAEGVRAEEGGRTGRDEFDPAQRERGDECATEELVELEGYDESGRERLEGDVNFFDLRKEAAGGLGERSKLPVEVRGFLRAIYLSLQLVDPSFRMRRLGHALRRGRR